jgi:AAA+ ATPase superfamily predicted ATPase
MGTIIGRKKEIGLLEKLYKSKKSEFLALYGRRRVGKTFLINEFFRNKGVFFEVTGVLEKDIKSQLKSFALEFADVFNNGKVEESPTTWQDAFHLLKNTLKKIDSNQKIILFFDEIPWLATPRSLFLPSLDYCWNRHLSRMNNIILIICGSAATWIINKILDDKGGLHGRITKEIRLHPFTLSETKEYLLANNIHLEHKQIVELYMALGGVAQYLTHVERGKSAAQNVNDICFDENGELYKEFMRLYRSLFNKYEHHIAIIRALSKTFQGLNKNELLKKTDLKSGGSSSYVFRELEEAGFIAKHPDFTRKKNNIRYRLIDEYSLFFLKWIEVYQESSYKKNETKYWLNKINNQPWLSWAGYVFEIICFKHISKIKKALGIEGVETYEYSWFYNPKKNSKEQGVQIDLLIDRADNCINVCEIKFLNTQFEIDKDYSNKLRMKKEVFRQKTGTRKSLITTLITTFGTLENSHFFEAVDKHLLLDVLFE